MYIPISDYGFCPSKAVVLNLPHDATLPHVVVTTNHKIIFITTS